MELRNKPKEFNHQEFEAWNDTMAIQFNPNNFHKRASGLVGVVNRGRVNKVLQFLAAEPSHRVLEVGCEAGNILAKAG